MWHDFSKVLESVLEFGFLICRGTSGKERRNQSAGVVDAQISRTGSGIHGGRLGGVQVKSEGDLLEEEMESGNTLVDRIYGANTSDDRGYIRNSTIEAGIERRSVNDIRANSAEPPNVQQ